jgi:hypothetical protein
MVGGDYSDMDVDPLPELPRVDQECDRLPRAPKKMAVASDPPQLEVGVLANWLKPDRSGFLRVKATGRVVEVHPGFVVLATATMGQRKLDISEVSPVPPWGLSSDCVSLRDVVVPRRSRPVRRVDPDQLLALAPVIAGSGEYLLDPENPDECFFTDEGEDS